MMWLPVMFSNCANGCTAASIPFASVLPVMMFILGAISLVVPTTMLARLLWHTLYDTWYSVRLATAGATMFMLAGTAAPDIPIPVAPLPEIASGAAGGGVAKCHVTNPVKCLVHTTRLFPNSTLQEPPAGSAFPTVWLSPAQRVLISFTWV